MRHIVIPDLTVPLGKQTETKKALTRFISALVEEGVVDLQSYAVSKTAKAEDLRCGLITTITPAALRDQRAGWRKFGCMTRMLPVSYSYSTSTVDAIYEAILKRQYRQESPFNIKLPDQDMEIIIPEKTASEKATTGTRLIVFAWRYAPAQTRGFIGRIWSRGYWLWTAVSL